MARITGVQEWAKPPDEVRDLLHAWQNYLRHFKVSATQKTVDLITALSITGFMYGPVVGGHMNKKRVGQAQRGSGQARGFGPAQVFQFRPPPPTAPAMMSQTSSPGTQANPPPPGPINGEAATGRAPPMQGPSPDMTYEPEFELAPA